MRCRHASAFFGTELVGKLISLGVDTLVICGVSTSGCVRATALDGMSYNFRPMVSVTSDLQLPRGLTIHKVVGTACGDRSPAIHDANIHDMDAKMADVVGEAEAIKYLKAGWS